MEHTFLPLLGGERILGEGMIYLRKTTFARKLRKNQTDVEKLLWKYLRNRRLNGVKFRRQHPVGPYIVDFVCLERQLVIELDGGQHNTEIGKASDKRRLSWLESEGYKVMRFWNNEIISDIDAVLDSINNSLNPPSPRGRRERGGKIR